MIYLVIHVVVQGLWVAVDISGSDSDLVQCLVFSDAINCSGSSLSS